MPVITIGVIVSLYIFIIYAIILGANYYRKYHLNKSYDFEYLNDLNNIENGIEIKKYV